MARIRVTDEWLYQYMPMAAEALLKEMEREVDYGYIFSAGFEKRMKRLLRRERYMKIWNVVHSAGGKGVRIAVIVLMLVFVLSTGIKAYQAAFFDTIRTVWEDSMLYRYMTNTKGSEELAVHEPSYLPEGYLCVEKNVNESFSEYLYEDKAGGQLICQQEMVQDGKTVIYDNEFDEKITVFINDCTAEVYRYDDGVTCSYLEYGNYVYTIFAENISIEDIRQIFLNWLWRQDEIKK